LEEAKIQSSISSHTTLKEATIDLKIKELEEMIYSSPVSKPKINSQPI
jgi:hypothetical protein